MKKSLLTVFFSAGFVVGFSQSLPAQNTVEPTVTIHATDAWASEIRLQTGTFTVRRTGPTNFPLAVFYNLSGTASNGVDYEALGHSVQMPAGALEASFTVRPMDDSLVEGTEFVLAELTGSPLACATCGYLIGEPSKAEVFITDNDPRSGTNSPPFVRLNEPQDGDLFRAPADITLRAYAQDAEDRFDLQVEFFEGTNSLGFGTFFATTCPAPYCPFFALTWSNVPPGEYVLSAKTTDSHGATSMSAPARVAVIETNIVPQAVVNIFASDATGSEIPVVPPWLDIPQRYDPAVFTVTRTGPTNQPLTVFYSVGGTAANGVDYDRLPGDVTIPAGAASALIEVSVTDDFLVEGTETVELKLEPPICIQMFPPPPGCYRVGPNSRAAAEILDNNPAGTNHAPFVRLNSPQNGDVFTAPADITLRAYAEDDEGDTGLQVEFFEGARSLGFGVFVPALCPSPFCPFYALTWSNVPPGDYTLTARATDSQGGSGVSDPVHIRVTGTDVPPPTNLVVVTIVASDAIAVEGPFCRSNWWWTTSGNGGDWTIAPAAGDPNSLSWRTNNCWGTNTAAFVVRRTGPTNAPLTVYYAIGGTASNGADYVTLPGQVVIGAGRRSARIEVVPVEDSAAEHLETVVLRLQPVPADSNAPPTYVTGFPSRAAAIILDNDRPRPSCMRLPDGLFHVCGPATNGHSFRVQASADLMNWTVLCTNTVTDGAFHFVDPDAANLNARFYHLAPVPSEAPQE
jgi:hypothetical protein